MGPTNESTESEGRQKALLRVFPVLVHRHNYVQTEGPILSYLGCRLKVQMSLAGHRKKNILVLLLEPDPGFIPSQYGAGAFEQVSQTNGRKIDPLKEYIIIEELCSYAELIGD